MKYLFYIGTFLAFSAPARAEDGEIVVTGSGWSQPASAAGQAISVIDAGRIAQVQGADVTRLLEQLPGVSWARNGGLGSATSLFVRGGDSQQVLVTIDGVRVADVAAPGGGFDLGTLLTGGVGRIELLRGSNSVVWGADAMAGVLAVTSDTAPGLAASLEYGAHDLVDAGLRAGVAGAGYNASITAGYARTDGISAFAGGSEPDGLRQWRLGGQGRVALGGGWALVAVGRYADSRAGFDGYPAPAYVFADTAEYQVTRQGSGRAGFTYDGTGLKLRGGVALASTSRDYFDISTDISPNYTTTGRSLRADLAARMDLPAGFELNLGADSEWTRFATLYDPRRTARLASGHALLGWTGSGLSLAAGARLDDSDRFGSHWTFGANGAVRLGQGWRLHASYGEGFRAPTLYQLYGYGGNPALAPETSRSVDAGIERGAAGDALRAGVTLFRRDARELIGYRYPTGYYNVGRTRAEGVEVEAELRPVATFALRGAYTYSRATDRASGADLPRRPRHALSLSADWTTPLAGLALGADLRVVGDGFDDAANGVRLDGYGLATLRASLPLGERLVLFGRVENIADTAYRTAAGYGSYGRVGYAGLRAKW